MKTCNNDKCILKGSTFVSGNFCPKCGKKLTEAMIEGICGHDTWKDDLYCKECGVYLLHDPRQDEEDENPTMPAIAYRSVKPDGDEETRNSL